MLLIPVVVAIAVIVFLAAIIQFVRWRKSPSYRLPPGPKGVAVLGNLIELMRSSLKGEAPFFKFAQWAAETGPICYLKFFRQRVVVISDAHVAQQLCVGQADKFSTRPSGLFLARILKGKGIVMNDGPSWKEHRLFISQGFRKHGLGHRSIEQRIQYVVDQFLQQIDKTVGKPHDLHLDLAVGTYNIIWTTISGDHFEWDDPFLHSLIVNLQTNLEAVELVGVHNYVLIFSIIHLLWHNPKRLLDIVNTRFTYFKKLIAQSKVDKDRESMIQDYINKVETAEKNQEETHLSEDQLLWLVSDLFIAGGETTITTMRWATLCLVTYPKIQERCRQELLDNATTGSDTPPTYAQRSNFPYLEAFIHEVFRFCGVTPGMWRSTSQDATYEDYDIPKDTWVLLHFYSMSHNKNHWDDPMQFRPERFLNSDGTFRKDEHLLAFSTGRRQCPGEILARTEIFLFLGNMLQKYRLELDQPVDIHAGTFGITYTPPPFKVIFSRV